jgi:hypothetical protein
MGVGEVPIHNAVDGRPVRSIGDVDGQFTDVLDVPAGILYQLLDVLARLLCLCARITLTDELSLRSKPVCPERIRSRPLRLRDSPVNHPSA